MVTILNVLHKFCSAGVLARFVATCFTSSFSMKWHPVYLYYRSKQEESFGGTNASITLLSKLTAVDSIEEDAEDWLFRVLEESSTEVMIADMANVGHVIQV